MQRIRQELTVSQPATCKCFVENVELGNGFVLLEKDTSYSHNSNKNVCKQNLSIDGYFNPLIGLVDQ